MSQEYNYLVFTAQNGLASSKTTSLAQDNEGYLWIGTESGLSRFDGKSFTNFNRFDGLTENKIDRLEFVNNKLFIEYSNKKYSVYENGKFKIVKDFPSVKRKSPLLNYSFLKNKKVKDAIIDKENTLWVATAKNGLIGLPLENFPIYTWNNSKNLKNVYQKSEKEYLLSYSDAIVKLSFKNSKPVFKTLHKHNNKQFTCAFMQNNSELWYGTDKGLFLKFMGTSIEYSFKELRNKTVNSIEKLANENLLISANNTLYQYKKSSNSIQKYAPEEFLETNSILKDKDKIFALAKGNILEINDDSKTLIFPFSKEYNGVKFSHIFVDENENYWISSIEKGVFFKENKTGKITHFSQENNLPFKTIHSCFVKENILWMVSNIGTIKYDLKSKKHTIFSDKYFSNIEFTSGVIKNNKNLYFTSNKGIISVFNTNTHSENKTTLTLKSFLVSGKNRNMDSTIQLSYQEFPIEINYQSVSLNSKIYFQHKLKGYEEKWSNPSMQTKVNYTNLPAGNYEFLIQSIRPNSQEVLDEKSILFTINIPFWKTKKFIYLALVFLAGIVLFFYFTRLIRLRKQKRKLQKLVEEKTYELSVQKQNIEQFSYSLSHDLKNPINNIKGLVEIMDGETKNNPEILKMLSESTENLENKIKSTIESIKRMQDNKREIENLSFDKTFRNVKQSLLLLIRQNKVEFTINFGVENIKYNPSILDSIFYNLISNSIKYKSPKRDAKIEISTKNEGEYIVLAIKDNGLGFDTNKDKEALFSIFERVHTHKKGSGLGLYMIKQMVELNGGTIDVESEIGVGSVFYVKLKSLA